MPELPLIDRVKIAAELVVPIVKQMQAELGTEQAHAIVRRGVSQLFRQMARDAMAEKQDPLQALLAMNSGVRQGIDIETDIRPGADGFEMDVSACVYARFFQELGEPDLGFILICSADSDIAEALPGVEMKRSQTIMQGADHCDFQYRFLKQETT